jgi:hypothetical protein
MANLRVGYVGLLLLMLSSLGLAQSAQPDSNAADTGSQPAAQSQENPDSDTGSDVAARAPRRRQRLVPCWKQAGMTPEMVNERWKIQDEQKTRIATVCSEPSSTAQQKRAKIDQIRLDTDLAIAHLIPAKELHAFNVCQAELEKSRPRSVAEKEAGPCGGSMAEGSEDAHQH